MRPFYPEIVVAGVTDVPRVDHCIYCDDIVIVFRGERLRARRVESMERCGADIATTLPHFTKNRCLQQNTGAHRNFSKRPRVLQIAVIIVKNSVNNTVIDQSMRQLSQ